MRGTMAENETAGEPASQPEAPPAGGIEEKILALAKEKGASIAKIARKVHKSRDLIREVLAAAGVTLQTQKKAASKATPAPVDGGKLISEVMDMTQNVIVEQYARDEASARLRSIHVSGVIVTDELAPEARRRGLLVSDLLRGAIDALAWRERLEAENVVILDGANARRPPGMSRITIEDWVDHSLAFVKAHNGAPDRIRRLEDALNLAGDQIAKERRTNEPMVMATWAASLRAITEMGQR